MTHVTRHKGRRSHLHFVFILNKFLTSPFWNATSSLKNDHKKWQAWGYVSKRKARSQECFCWTQANIALKSLANFVNLFIENWNFHFSVKKFLWNQDFFISGIRQVHFLVMPKIGEKGYIGNSSDKSISLSLSLLLPII